MKKIISCLCLILTICVLSGCRYHYIKAETGSRWKSDDGAISITILDGGGSAEGFLKNNDEIVDIVIYFGPNKTEYIVYESINRYEGDSWLFRGDYYYSEKNNTITFKILEKQIELNKQEIVLKLD